MRTLSFLGFFALLLGTVKAQNGQFDLRLQLKNTDCAGKKIQVALEIKAHNEKSSFLMGNANFRLTYDARQVNKPVLVRHHHFSSIGDQPDLNYGPLSLNGSVEGISRGVLSLNILYSGSEKGAASVGASWLPIATLEFEIVDVQRSDESIIQLNDDKTFPISGLSEIILKSGTNEFDYDAYAVKAGGIFESLSIKPFKAICSGSSPSVADGELVIPDGFSPNGDGVNDRFVIRNLGQLKAELTILDRNGTVILEDKDYQNTWDGRDRGRDLPAGTYFYSIRLSDGRKFVRSLTLSR